MAKDIDTVPIEVIILTADHEIKGTVQRLYKFSAHFRRLPTPKTDGSDNNGNIRMCRL